MRASAARSLRCATAASSLRNASRLGSLTSGATLTATGLYGPGGAACGAPCAKAEPANATASANALAARPNVRMQYLLNSCGRAARALFGDRHGRGAPIHRDVARLAGHPL